MKSKFCYKKKTAPQGKSHSGSRQARRKKSSAQPKKKMSNLNPSRAQVLWDSSSITGAQNAPAKFVQDKSWALNYQHFSDLLADFSVKAGSKNMILTSSIDAESGRSKLSESQLLKKYR